MKLYEVWSEAQDGWWPVYRGSEENARAQQDWWGKACSRVVPAPTMTAEAWVESGEM